MTSQCRPNLKQKSPPQRHPSPGVPGDEQLPRTLPDFFWRRFPGRALRDRETAQDLRIVPAFLKLSNLNCKPCVYTFPGRPSGAGLPPHAQTGNRLKPVCRAQYANATKSRPPTNRSICAASSILSVFVLT